MSGDIHYTLKLDPVQKILMRRSLEANGKAQRFFTHEVRRLADPYVPLLNGPLKNTAREEVNRIVYIQPYGLCVCSNLAVRRKCSVWEVNLKVRRHCVLHQHGCYHNVIIRR